MKQYKHRLRLVVRDNIGSWSPSGGADNRDFHWAPEYTPVNQEVRDVWIPSEIYGHNSVTRINRRYFWDEYENRRSFAKANKLPDHVYTPGKKPRRLPAAPNKKPWKKDTWYHPIPEMRNCLSVDVKTLAKFGLSYPINIVNKWARGLDRHRKVSGQLLFNSYLTMRKNFMVDGALYTTQDTSFDRRRRINLRRGDDPVVRMVLDVDGVMDRVHANPSDVLDPFSGKSYERSSSIGEYYVDKWGPEEATYLIRDASRNDYWLPHMSASSFAAAVYYTRLTDEERQDLVDKAWQHIRPTLNGGAFNIVNFLYELKDFKSLLKVIRSKTVLRELKKFFFDKETLTFRGLLDRATTLHLQWAFAIAPLVSDIRELWQRLTNMEMLVERYIANGDGQPHRRRKRLRLPDLHEYGIALVHVPQRYLDGTALAADAVERFYIERRITQRFFTCTAVFTYRAGELRRTADHIFAKLDLLGVSLNPATIWNALPFSFVVDWFLRIGDYLEKMNINNFRNISETLLDFCVTEAYEQSEHVYWINPENRDKVLVGTVLTSYYERRKELPTDRSPIRSEFVTREILLAGSLAYKLGIRDLMTFAKKK